MSGIQSLLGAPPEIDYKIVFEQTPGMCLILDPTFRIIAQNLTHARATLSTERSIVGKGLFEVFPDNPDDPYAKGVAAVRESLLKVMKTRRADTMPIIRYDVRPHSGNFQQRYWAITNTPILGEDGFVHWIINRAEDVTGLVQLQRRDQNAEFCREQANRARARASKTIAKEDSEAFASMAADWEALANEIASDPAPGL